MLAELLVFQMCAVCIGFAGHVCPVVDGEMQHWDCNEQWTIMYMPQVFTWYSADLKQHVAGEWFVDMYGVITLVIGGSLHTDAQGYAIFTHEIRHAQCVCNWH